MLTIHVASNPDYCNEIIKDTRIVFYIPAVGYFGSYFKDSGKCGLLSFDNNMPEMEVIKYGGITLYGIKSLIEQWDKIEKQKQENLYMASCILEKAYLEFEKKNPSLELFHEYLMNCVKDYCQALNCLCYSIRINSNITKSPVYEVRLR